MVLVKRSDLRNTVVLLLLGLLGCFSVEVFRDPIVSLFAIWGFAVIAAKMVKFDLSHPYVWLSLFFVLYNTAYTIAYCMGYLGELGYDYRNTLYPFLSLLVILLIIGVRREKVREYVKCLDKKGVSSKFLRSVLIAISILIAVFSIVLVLKGYSGKAEMKLANDIFYRIGVYLVRFNAMFMILYLFSGDNNKKKIVALSVVSSVVFSLVTGERDAMFRSIFSLVLALFVLGKIRKKHLLILIPIFMVFMILSVAFKYYVSSGVINLGFLGVQNIFYSFLSTDFLSTGENFQKLLTLPWTEGYMGPGLILSEIFSFLLPSSAVADPDHWLNYEVYTGEYHGRAFTLMGTGYVAYGIIGILLISVLLALLVRYLYRKSTVNIYYMSVYIYMITTIIFSFRQSLSVIFVALFRVALVSVLICVLNSRARKNES